MSLLDLINTVRIGNLESSNRNQARMTDLESRVRAIGDRTGTKPLEWYNFKHEFPLPESEEPTRVSEMASSAVVGTVIGLVIGGISALLGNWTALIALPVMGAVAGAIAGCCTSLEDKTRERQLSRYERYLDAVEESRGHARAPEIPAIENHAAKSNHLETLLARKDVQPSRGK